MLALSVGLIVLVLLVLVFIITSKVKEKKIKLLEEKLLNQNDKLGSLHEELKKGEDKLFEHGATTKSKSFVHEQIQRIEELESEVEGYKKRLQDAKLIAQEANMIKYGFLANIRHEVRTPMNSILVFADMLHSSVSDATLQSYAKNISKSGHQLLDLIDKIIELSDLESGIFKLQEKAVNISLLFNNIVEQQKKKALQKGLEIHLEIDDDVPESLIVDDGKIQEILENFIDNAIKFTKKGSIDIFVKVQDPNVINNTINLSISVKDTGMGISLENQKRIFEIFEKRENANELEFQGSGLGLSINKKMAQKMNGDILLKSDLNEGSEFQLLLRNLEIVLMDSDATNVENIDFSIISKARVMVVDSAEENRKVIAECFEQTDVEVFHFNNPRSAIESLKEYEFDLIFMDVDLLETDDGAVSIVMAKISKAPVISLTTKGLKNIDFVSNGLKVVGHIKKPISKIELFKICIRVLNSSHLLNEKGEMTEEINLFEEANEDNARDFLKEEAQKVSSLYKLAYASNDLNQIKEFAQSLQEVAQKYKIDYFLSYSNDLLKKIELFDIDTISKMMNNYIKVLNLLKKKAK